ncbi:MAG: putative porin, partial [Bacteroidota bacterium]
LAQLSSEVQNWQTRNRIRLYNEYKMADLFRLFFITEYFWQRDNYRDEDLATNASFYGVDTLLAENFLVDSARIGDNYRYRLFTQKAGIKGQKGAINYWAYAKRRDYSVSNGEYDSIYTIRGRSENFVGGRLNLYLADSTLFDVEGEYLIGRDYLLKAQFKSKWFSAGVQSTFYSPTIAQDNYFSNIDQWDNNFNSTLSNDIFGELRLSLGNLEINPSGRYSIINNYIYFQELLNESEAPQDVSEELNDLRRLSIVPQQSSAAIQQLQFRLQLNYQWRKLHFDNTVTYTSEISNTNLLRFPELLINSHVYYSGKIYRDVVYGQVGFQFNYRTAYRADAYAPAFKQFYLQDDFLVRNYPLLDVYASFLIKKVRVFLKLSHVNQGWLPPPLDGYAVTPFYAGMQRTLSFGFNWLFFD